MERLTQTGMAAVRSDGERAELRSSESIEELFLALESPLLSYARRLSPNIDMAEDIVQEAFVRLHHQFDHVHTPRSWLYRTVHNLALNRERDATKIAPLPDSEGGEAYNIAELTDPQPLPDEQIARWEGVGLVRLNLKNLDSRSQELIRLKFDEDLSYKQISERTGLTVSNVGYLLHHLLKSLVADLTKAGLAP